MRQCESCVRKKRRRIVSAGSADAENFKLLLAGRELRDAAATIDMKLHEPFKIGFNISAQPDQHHKLRAILRHLIEYAFGTPPEPVRCDGDAGHIGRKPKVAEVSGRNTFNHRAHLRDAVLLKPLRHALERAFSHHVKSCQGRCICRS